MPAGRVKHGGIQSLWCKSFTHKIWLRKASAQLQEKEGTYPDTVLESSIDLGIASTIYPASSRQLDLPL
ncbi:hypothetical protein Vi05172_g11319 [Venturia inaequalis]|nr:hypothetical protein Vi05172_g11319 [Venturia inaequalis]